MMSLTRRITVAGMLSAVAAVLMYLEIPIPLVPPFIKLDFSELPALLASFSMGPVWGGVVCLVKNLVKLLSTGSGGVGELANFLMGVCFVVPAGVLYGRKKSRRTALWGAIAGALCMAVMSEPINEFVVYPIYYQFMDKEAVLTMYKALYPSIATMRQALWRVNVPFTFAKALCSALILFPLYPKVSPFLKGVKR